MAIMVKIKGTEKQIAWAEKIREEFIKIYDEYKKNYAADDRPSNEDEIFLKTCRIAQSEFWIEFMRGSRLNGCKLNGIYFINSLLFRQYLDNPEYKKCG